jgi:hypothetical protein
VRGSAVSPAVRFDQLIAEYVGSHPDYTYPESGDRHPAILAQGTSIKPWLIDRLGGFPKYLTAILDAAKIWFPPGCRDREFRLFCHLFEISANCGWGNFPEMKPYDDRYCTWMFGVRNSLRTLVRRLRETQEKNFPQDFAHLAQLCKRRYLPAARLTQSDESDIEGVAKLGVDTRIDVQELREGAEAIWERCVRMYDRPQQGKLFTGWPDHPDKLWNRYFYKELAPVLSRDDEVVRQVLRGVGALSKVPLRSPSQDLASRLLEISIPDFDCWQREESSRM